MATQTPRYEMTLGAEELVRFSYAHLFKTHVNSNNSRSEFGSMLLIPKTSPDGKRIAEMVARIKKEMYVDLKKPVPPNFWNPLRDGDKDVKQDGSSYGPAAEGHWVVSAKNAERKDGTPPTAPKVVGTQKGQDGKLLPLTGGIKSGDYGRVGITLYGYTTGDQGVGVGLRTVQLVREGEALGSDANPDADFGGFADEEDVL